MLNDFRKTTMKDYIIEGKKKGEYKQKNGLYLCYYPRKGRNSRHETCENVSIMKQFFERQR